MGGIGLCILDMLAHAFVIAPALSFYQNQLQSFPVKQTYSRAELADAAWQVWTNRVTLPEQSAYTVVDLKAALIRPLLGTQQDSCDRMTFEYAIAQVAGFRIDSNHLMAFVGFFSALVGAFLLGGVVSPAKIEPPSNTETGCKFPSPTPRVISK